ncbi:MAG: 8-oxoguanine glycosylase domain protein, partial [Armatimonadetes bacterium]|nr:8-oxoguanine glycosylase domain protein [Armatimonadota bacterium]
SNIPKIERSTEYLAREWGTVHRWPEGVEVASVPTPAVLAAVEDAALRSSGAGYRCRYFIGTAARVAAGETDLHACRKLPYRQALERLLHLPGVGRKVADCVLLFALDQPEACPVDVWVRRVIHELYPEQLLRHLPDAALRVDKALTPREYDAMLEFARSQWGPLAGYAQQYLFHARRTNLIGPGALSGEL